MISSDRIIVKNVLVVCVAFGIFYALNTGGAITCMIKQFKYALD